MMDEQGFTLLARRVLLHYFPEPALHCCSSHAAMTLSIKQGSDGVCSRSGSSSSGRVTVVVVVVVAKYSKTPTRCVLGLLPSRS